jgi:hypothetical protein
MFREIDLSPSSGETIEVRLITESVQRYMLSVPYVLYRKVSPFPSYCNDFFTALSINVVSTIRTSIT